MSKRSRFTAISCLGLLACVSAAGLYAVRSTETQIRSELAAKKADCASQVASMQQLGLFQDIQRDKFLTNVAVDEGSWTRLDRISQMQYALTVHCADMSLAGSHTVQIRAKNTGKVLSTVVNGNYQSAGSLAQASL